MSLVIYHTETYEFNLFCILTMRHITFEVKCCVRFQIWCILLIFEITPVYGLQSLKQNGMENKCYFNILKWNSVKQNKLFIIGENSD